MKIILPIALVLSFFLALMHPASGQKKKKLYDLKQLQKENQLKVYGRGFIETAEKSKSSVKLDEKSGEGIAWVHDLVFSEGVIEIDLKGKDELQKSFLGIAFHGENDSTFDAVYFRPFNFQAKDSIRKIHAVQYVSHPEFGWKKLRDERNGEFEKAVNPAPDPNEWFHAKIEVKDSTVTVYINNSPTPSLTIKKLNKRKSGRLGIWTGDGSGGEFANLVIFEK